MRNLKRVLSLALALVMVLGMMVITTSAADFTDAEEITQIEAVEVLAAIGMVEGSNGKFNPNGTFTREAAAKLITYMKIGPEMAEKLAGTDVFTDVAATRWSAKYIGYCANLKIIKGNGDGTFNPEGELTDIALGKLLLCAALGKDASKYEGDNWATAVTIDMLDAGLVDSVTGTAISREDACEMILTAMKMTSTPETYNVVKNGKTIKSFTDLLDAYLYAEVLKADDVVPAEPTDSLLYSVYNVTYNELATDEFGRPGIRYTDVKTSGKKINVFVGTEKVAEYVGEVKGGTLYTDLGEPESVTVQVYVDGNKWADSNATVASLIVEDGKANAITDSSGNVYTGNSVVTEVYATGEDAYTIVVVNTYADTVKEVTEADEEKEIKASIKLSNNLPYETDKFAKGDAVLYTMANGKIQEIVKNETVVSGTPTKNANGAWTIGEGSYKVSFTTTDDELGLELGAKGEWYADANGNLIAVKVAAETAEKEYTVAVILDAAGVDYDKGTEGSLISEGEAATDAKEVIKVKTAADEVLVLDTAWEYVLDEDDEWVSTTFVNGNIVEDKYVVDNDKGTLVKYHVDKDGKVDEIIKLADVGSDTADFTVTKGDAVLGTYGKFGTDETVYFLTDGKTYDVYVGYANAPTKTGKLVAWAHEDNVVSALVLSVEELTADTKGDDAYVFVAGTDYTAEWNAEDEVIVYVYEDLYVDGVKTTLTFEEGKVPTLVKGEMYAYNTKTGVKAGNLLTGTTTVNNVQSGFFRYGTTITYTDADTAYVQIDAEKGTIADAEALPSIKDYTVTILKVDSKDDVATTVYFSAVEIEE